jgi:uncharacterized membrane protein (UPF0127 family)
MGQLYRLETASGSVVADQVELADTMWSRFMGLMFRRELLPGHGLAIRPCNSIHMFFMRFALDVVFVDADGRVVRVLNSIRPWRASSLVRGAKAAIELPAGTAARSVLVPGMVLRMVETPGPAGC